MSIIFLGSVLVTKILLRNDPTKKSEISPDTGFLAKFTLTLIKLLNLSVITFVYVTILL